MWTCLQYDQYDGLYLSSKKFLLPGKCKDFLVPLLCYCISIRYEVDLFVGWLGFMV